MFRAPRGTPDILSQEQAYWRYVEQKAAAICQLYGYQRIDTPVFEDTGLFKRGVGEGTDIVDKQMYTFRDRGDNSLTLRPEGTAPVCRAYLEHGMHNLPQPVKLYYITPIFRYERPQAGRYRQHYQFGCEAIGDNDPALDAEIISVAWRFFASLSLRRLTLQLNSIGCPQCRPAYTNALRDHYATNLEQLCTDCKRRLQANPLRLLDCKEPACQQEADAAPRSTDYLCPACREHFDRLQNYLQLLELPFAVNHRLVRGLDYYTRTVFEIQPEEGGSQSTIGGGGRYDGLIEALGGRATPAIGFASGIERIILNLKNQAVAIPPLPTPQLYIISLGEAARNEALKLAAELRGQGIGALQSPGGKSLKGQLRQAGKLGVGYTVIIGEQEMANGSLLLRNMNTSEQKAVPRDGLVAELPPPEVSL